MYIIFFVVSKFDDSIGTLHNRTNKTINIQEAAENSWYLDSNLIK
jgi:hypothetical protein